MKTKLFNLFTVLFLIPFFTLAQTLVNGTVREEATSQPLPGVNVIIKGTTQGTSTDFDGNYSITLNDGDTIVFSYVGFVTQEIIYNGQATININLIEDAALLNEVVVIGYGSTTKQDATGAVEKVSDEEFNKGAIVSPQQLLSGKSAGVRITSNSGAAGEGSEIRIRGGASLTATNEPLIVIDGLPLDPRGVQGTRNTLNAINPADIEDFVVLKDASATAIYGSRASNGVILITTKKGRTNSPLTIEYDLKASARQVTDYVDVLSAKEYRDLQNTSTLFNPDLLGNSTTNWQDEIFETATGAIHNITVSKGYDNFNFRANFNHASQEGPVLGDLYERNALNTAFVHRFLDNDLKITLTAKAIQDQFFYPDDGAIGSAIAFDPTQSVLDENGNYTELGDNLAPRNPVALLEQNENRNTIDRAIGNFNIDYKLWFLEGLRFNLNLGLDYAENRGKQFNVANPNNPDSFKFTNLYSGLNKNTLLDFYFNYKSEVESINTVLDLTAGHSFQEFFISSNRTFTGAEGNLINDPITKDRNALESYFARASFDIADKYLLSLSYRRDGSSRFSEDNRWGNFPGVSLGWKISNEDFLKDSFFSNLKLRAGWGVTGQQEITENYGYLGLYQPASNNQVNVQFGFDSAGNPIFINTLRPTAFDENLKWEETSQYNAAIDFGLFNNRLTGTIDGYYRETTDLLAQVPVPAGSNLSDQLTTNVGETVSRGLEISLDGKIIEKENLNWSANFNITFQDREITRLNLSRDSEFSIPQGAISGGTGNTIQLWKPGLDPTTFFVYRQVYDNDGNPIEGAYVDVNGDDQITTADRQAYKKATPDAFIGFTNNLSYKNLDLSFTFRGSFGNYVYNNVASSRGNLATVVNTLGDYQPNAHASVLSTGFSDQQLFSDAYIQRADFLRLDNISLSYLIPFEKVKLRTSLTASNLFVITEYDGLDPEIPNGIDNNFYPRTRDIVLGLNFTF